MNPSTTEASLKDSYWKHYNREYNSLMQQKLGLDSINETLVESLFEVMTSTRSDFTNTFRLLAKVKKEGANLEVIDELCGIAVDKDFLIKKSKHPHGDNPKMHHLLEH